MDFKELADGIIKIVQEESVINGFQYILSFTEIEDRLEFPSEDCLWYCEEITEALLQHKEVADVQVDMDGFDIVLYTAYAPNYNEEDYE